MSTTRRLRQYKNLAYDPETQMFVNSLSGHRCLSVVDIVYDYCMTDDDLAPLLSLKADPYEPMPVLEHMILECGRNSYKSREQYAHELARRIRAAFPHIDTPPVEPTPLTAQDHIKALEKMGATMVDDGFSRYLSLPKVMLP